MPSRSFSRSDISPIPDPAIPHHRPSCCMTSIMFRSPAAAPFRTWTAWGAPVIESNPPTSTQDASSARIIPAATATELMLARQTSFSVIPGTSRATPPMIAARRPGFWPFAA